MREGNEFQVEEIGDLTRFESGRFREGIPESREIGCESVAQVGERGRTDVISDHEE